MQNYRITISRSLRNFDFEPRIDKERNSFSPELGGARMSEVLRGMGKRVFSRGLRSLVACERTRISGCRSEIRLRSQATPHVAARCSLPAPSFLNLKLMVPLLHRHPFMIQQ